ncbi:MAG: 16S rRNA (cytidine(1402)-2'-O)-methyltransferase [Enterococcus sp.]
MRKQRSFKEQTNWGAVYLVPTPIGNLEDMTYRSVKTLQEVALIASEDTRNTQKLLNHFEISTPQKSLHEHNYKERIPQLIEFLKTGQSIAQVSDAGMPSISDPGHELVLACLAEAIPVISLPGATAGLTALIASGLSPQPNLFYGFLPRKKSEQVAELEQLQAQSATLIFYESPYRIAATIKVMAEVLGDRQAVICRELTKIHEEYLRGTFTELQAYLAENAIKGECCLLVAGNDGKAAVVQTDLGTMKEQVELLITEGLTPNQAIKEVAKRQQVKKQVVYKEYHGINA